jgi:hypothetical protein
MLLELRDDVIGDSLGGPKHGNAEEKQVIPKCPGDQQ